MRPAARPARRCAPVSYTLGLMRRSTYSPQPGDLVEIQGDHGFAYIQCVKNVPGPPNYGSVIRVLPGAWSQRPDDLRALVHGPHQFMCLYPLQLAVRGRGTESSFISRFPLPSGLQEQLLFRASSPLKAGGYSDSHWWLWDTEKEWFVGKLEPKHQQLPIRGVWNQTLLIERLLAGHSNEGNRE